MTLLWVNLAIVFSFTFLSRYIAIPSQVYPSTLPVKPNKLLFTGVLLSFVIISGLRSNIGDTFYYMHAYEVNQFTWDFILSEKDIGFSVLQMILKSYVSEDPQVLIFTTALVTNVFILVVLYHYSKLIELSLYVYITGGLFLVTMNGIRQALAGAIAFTAIKFLIEGDWKKYFLIIFVASLFHQSALVLIPIYFVVRLPAWSKVSITLILLSVVFVVGYQQFSSVLFEVIEDTQYGHYRDFAEGGANLIRVVVEGVPLFIAYLGREKLKELFPSSDYIVNMTLIGFLFMVISTQNWIFARFSLYFGLYQLILISWLIQLFKDRDQKFVYYVILICYFAYYYYENVITLDINYQSNYLVW